jgi:putative transposase
MVDFLQTPGILVGPKRVRRLLRKMGIMSIYPRRSLSKLGAAKYVRPYRLRRLEFTHSNQVWCIDITNISMKEGFLYLTAIIDVYSRYIVGWEISNTLDAENSLKVLRKAIAEHGKPEIVNSDQGLQFTCLGWVEYLEKAEITISMDGRNRTLDNIWIERFWHTLKQEYVCIYPADNGNMLRKGLKKFINYYNNRRTYQSLDRKTPFDWYEYAA